MSSNALLVSLRGPNDFYTRSGSLKWAVFYPLREDSVCECAYCSISHGLLSLRRVSIGSCVSAFLTLLFQVCVGGGGVPFLRGVWACLVVAALSLGVSLPS